MTAMPEPDAWEVPHSIKEDKDALRVSPLRCVEGGVGGLRPECDFCPRRLPGLGDKKEFVGGGGAAESASL